MEELKDIEDMERLNNRRKLIRVEIYSRHLLSCCTVLDAALRAVFLIAKAIYNNLQVEKHYRANAKLLLNLPKVKITSKRAA